FVRASVNRRITFVRASVNRRITFVRYCYRQVNGLGGGHRWICLMLEVGRLQLPDEVAAPTEYIAWKFGVGKTTITFRKFARDGHRKIVGLRGRGCKDRGVLQQRRVGTLVEKLDIGLERVWILRINQPIVGVVGTEIGRNTEPLEVEGYSVELLRNQLGMADKEPSTRDGAITKRKKRLFGVSVFSSFAMLSSFRPWTSTYTCAFTSNSPAIAGYEMVYSFLSAS